MNFEVFPLTGSSRFSFFCSILILQHLSPRQGAEIDAAKVGKCKQEKF
jgi:hypothetical protein